MEELLDGMLQEKGSRKTFLSLQKLLMGCITDDSFIKKNTWATEIPILGHALLKQELGFRIEDSLWIPPPTVSDKMIECQELIDCMLMSLDDDMPAAVEGVKDDGGSGGEKATTSKGDKGTTNAALDEDLDEEMQAALALSLGDGDTDTKMGNGDDEDKERVSVAFERFNTEEVVHCTSIADINAIQESLGEAYVDPQFEASNKALYMDPNDATTWQCLNCGKRNQLPPLFSPPSSMQEAQALNDKLDSVRCQHCSAVPGNAAKVLFTQRPGVWLRPGGERDPITEMLYPTIKDASMKSMLCTGFIRDDMKNTLGRPWAVIREEARPEDVVQGAIGNCWFAGALSCVAGQPKLIEKLFANSREYNKWGAYEVKLCHSGQWRNIILDDLFPCSKAWEGKIVGGTIHFARGGELSYLQSRRRQLWVPLIEKAAAKLFGCYGALNSGTFSEALGLLTGYPVETMRLFESKHARETRQKRRTEMDQKRLQCIIQGLPPMEEDEEEVEKLDDTLQDNILWTRLLSYYEAGYIMGLACAAEAVEKTRDEVVGVGLQSPHAYGVMEVRELMIPTKDGKSSECERLIKVRNPWGDRAPQTWKGKWGTEWSGWTFDLQKKLGVVNSSGVKMHEEMGIFWINFEDMRKYFMQVEVCRVHPEYWVRRTGRLWLPSSVGAGNMVQFDVYQRTELDIVLWQEKHVKREAALNAKSTNQDIGFGVFRKYNKACYKQGVENTSSSDCSSSNDSCYYEYIGRGPRTRGDLASSSLVVEGGYTYYVIPYSFSLINDSGVFPRQSTLTIDANHKISEMTIIPSSWTAINTSLWSLLDATVSKFETQPVIDQNAVENRQMMPGLLAAQMKKNEDAISIVKTDGDCGYIVAAENRSYDRTIGIQSDITETLGMIGSRVSGMTADVIPPRHRLILNTITPSSKANVIMGGLGMSYLDPSFAESMATPQCEFHVVVPIAADERTLKNKTPSSTTSTNLGTTGQGGTTTIQGQATTPAVGGATAATPAATPGAQDIVLTKASANPELTKLAEPDDECDGWKQTKVTKEAAPQAAAAASVSITANGTAPNGGGIAPNGGSAAPNGASQNEEDEDLLKEAMAMSVDPKMTIEARVKVLFSTYVKEGLTPNEAAVKAMQEAKKQHAQES